MGQEERAMDIRPVESCNLDLGPNWKYLVPTVVFVRRGVGERMIITCVFLTLKHGGGGVMVWVFFLVTLSVIYLELKAHLTSIANTEFCSDTTSHLVWA